jgi:hypothetical protein
LPKAGKARPPDVRWHEGFDAALEGPLALRERPLRARDIIHHPEKRVA